LNYPDRGVPIDPRKLADTLHEQQGFVLQISSFDDQEEAQLGFHRSGSRSRREMELSRIDRSRAIRAVMQRAHGAAAKPSRVNGSRSASVGRRCSDSFKCGRHLWSECTKANCSTRLSNSADHSREAKRAIL